MAGTTTSARWRNEEYDRLYRAAETELDPGKRAGLFIRMQRGLVINNFVAIPLVSRPRIAGVSNTLRDAVASGSDSDFWHLPYSVSRKGKILGSFG